MVILPNYNFGFRWEAVFCHSGWLPGQWCCHLQKHGGWICPSHNKIWFQMDQRYPWGAMPLGCWGWSDGQGHQEFKGRSLDCSSRISAWCFAYEWSIDTEWSDQSTHQGGMFIHASMQVAEAKSNSKREALSSGISLSHSKCTQYYLPSLARPPILEH